MTDKNPAALRLAEDIATDAALEIRRLHEENETLKKCLFQMQNAAIELAKPEQEPIGWFLKDHLETYMESYKDIEGAIPLYTSQPRKEWVGLTDKEIADFSNWLSCMNLVKAVEAKLKEKNGG
jgi:hypothetical protein